jgi:hypothetical protein
MFNLCIWLLMRMQDEDAEHKAVHCCRWQITWHGTTGLLCCLSPEAMKILLSRSTVITWSSSLQSSMNL